MGENKSVKTRIVDTIMKWIKTIGGTIFVVTIIKFFKRKAWFAERKVEQKELELKYKENEETIENENENRNDIDIVRDAIREGGDGGNSKS